MAALEAFLLGASAPSAALFLFLSSWAAIVCLMNANAGCAFLNDRQSLEAQTFYKSDSDFSSFSTGAESCAMARAGPVTSLL
jgi:hypothetical protein